MDLRETTSNWLHEWEAISRRIESIDARLWQGAGILLVISIGGISLLGWSPPETKADFLFAFGTSLFSILVLITWWFIFHRWIHLQRIYSHRAREIEDEIDLRLNRYARLLEHWESETMIAPDKGKLKEKDPAAYDRLQKFWENQRKRRFGHVTIQWALRSLTAILIFTWIAFILFYTVGYFWPELLGLT